MPAGLGGAHSADPRKPVSDGATVALVPYRAPVLRPYRDLLVTPGGLRFSSAAFIARMPISMIGLGIVLLVVAKTDSYGRAGALSAAFALVNAGAAPVIARLVDRFGQRRVLLRAVAGARRGADRLRPAGHPRGADLGAGRRRRGRRR